MTNEDEEWFNHKFQFKQLEWSNQHSEGSQHWKYHQSRLQTNKCLLRLSLELYEPNSEQVIRGWKWFNQRSKKIWPCRAITRRPSSPLGMVARHDLMTLSLKVACKKLPLPSWIFFHISWHSFLTREHTRTPVYSFVMSTPDETKLNHGLLIRWVLLQ